MCLSGWDRIIFNHSWLRHSWLKIIPSRPLRHISDTTRQGNPYHHSCYARNVPYFNGSNDACRLNTNYSYIESYLKGTQSLNSTTITSLRHIYVVSSFKLRFVKGSIQQTYLVYMQKGVLLFPDRYISIILKDEERGGNVKKF